MNPPWYRRDSLLWRWANSDPKFMARNRGGPAGHVAVQTDLEDRAVHRIERRFIPDTDVLSGEALTEIDFAFADAAAVETLVLLW